jgi:cytochrome c oxidase accessory protein FixG
MEELPEFDDFRDRQSTIGVDGSRVWVYPKKPKGKLYNYRKLVSLLLVIVFTGLPFIKLNGEPLVLFNILERKFIILGVMFYPQDFHLFVLSMIAFIVFVVLFTVIFGRIFCGWICPQTIFMEFVYRQIEYWIEGNYSQQRKLDEDPLNLNKFVRKSAKHIIFYLISFVTAHFFLAYLFGMDYVKSLITDGPQAHLAGFIGMLVFSAVHYFVFAKLREQVCIIICPYGRMQGVLLDRNSIVISYDYKRGEPRAKYNPLENRETAGKGDCVECSSCQIVCPTGIDIRNGTQLECINCTACIDACNAVMRRIKKPEGLIRYASERSIADKIALRFNFRILFYSAILAGLLILIAFLFSIRTEIEPTILRAKGTMYQEYDADHYSNIYTLQVINKTRKTLPVELILDEPEHGEIKLIGGPLVVEMGQVGEVQFLLVLPKHEIESSNTKVEFRVMCEGKKMDEVESTFVGPNSLDDD